MYGEFSFIKDYLTPLTGSSDIALGLADDAALCTPPVGKQLVLTKDAIVEGVHFLSTDTAEHIAQKLLRVNLSDLAAMGAEPYLYLLALILPKTTTEEWLKGFVQGLQADLSFFGGALVGGPWSPA